MGSSPSLFTRIRWRLQDLKAEQDAKVIAGLVLLVALAVGGAAAARAVAHASSPAPARAGVRVMTVRQKVRVRVDGHVVTRWRMRKVYAQAQTLLRTQTIRTPNGTRVVARPVLRYRIAYRRKVVTAGGRTRTVSQPVTNTKTQLVTSTREVTNTQVVTITKPVTVAATTTVVSTETESLPITVTVTVPVP